MTGRTRTCANARRMSSRASSPNRSIIAERWGAGRANSSGAATAVREASDTMCLRESSGTLLV